MSHSILSHFHFSNFSLQRPPFVSLLVTVFYVSTCFVFLFSNYLTRMQTVSAPKQVEIVWLRIIQSKDPSIILVTRHLDAKVRKVIY